MNGADTKLSWQLAAVMMVALAAFALVVVTALSEMSDAESVRVWSGVSLLIGVVVGGGIALVARRGGNSDVDQSERRLDAANERTRDALSALCAVLAAVEPEKAEKLRAEPVVQKALHG